MNIDRDRIKGVLYTGLGALLVWLAWYGFLKITVAMLRSLGVHI